MPIKPSGKMDELIGTSHWSAREQLHAWLRLKDKKENNMSLTESDKKNIELICIGFVPGFLMAMNESMEWVILEPFLVEHKVLKR